MSKPVVSERNIEFRAYSTPEGVGCFRSPRTYRATQDCDPDQQRQEAAALRAWLATALGNADLDLALKIFVEGMTCREFGAARHKHRSTGCREKRRVRTHLRAAILAAAWRPGQMQCQAPSCVEQVLTNLRIALIAEASHEEMIRSRRCMSDPRTAASITPTFNCVGLIAVREERYPSLPTVRDIAGYVRRHQEVLFQDDDTYLRGWHCSEHDVWFLAIAGHRRADAGTLPFTKRESPTSQAVREQTDIIENRLGA